MYLVLDKFCSSLEVKLKATSISPEILKCITDPTVADFKSSFPRDLDPQIHAQS